MVVIIAPLNSIINQEIQKLGQDAFHVKKGELLPQNCTFYIGHPEDILQNIDNINKNADIVYVVIDEAHCILEWGKEFRPEYQNIAKVRSSFDCIRMLAVTATASKSSMLSIAKSLGMKDYTQISSAPVLNRNISLSVRPVFPQQVASILLKKHTTKCLNHYN